MINKENKKLYKNEIMIILFQKSDSKIKVIDDIAFELFAMDCGIGRGIRQKKIPQEK